MRVRGYLFHHLLVHSLPKYLYVADWKSAWINWLLFTCLHVCKYIESGIISLLTCYWMVMRHFMLALSMCSVFFNFHLLSFCFIFFLHCHCYAYIMTFFFSSSQLIWIDWVYFCVLYLHKMIDCDPCCCCCFYDNTQHLYSQGNYVANIWRR